MRCPNCGNENPPDYVFCDECGARLQEGEGTENSPNIPAEEVSTPPNDGGTDDSKIQGIQPLSSMVVTPSQDDNPSGETETEPEALSTPVSDEATGPTEDGTQDAQDDADIPLTEDTVASTIPADDEGMTGDGSVLSAESMPDVVEIDSSDASMSSTSDAVSTMNAPDISPAASGTPAVADEGATAGWASTALAQLDEAQQAMAKGDYVGYGQSLGNLRSLLEGIASGATSGGTATQTVDSASSAGMAPTPITQAQEQGSGSYAASNADSLGSIPMVEPAAEAGTLTAEPEAEPAQQDMPSTGTTEAAVPVAGEPSAVARLVVISTGAELPLPDQEEISVGREDPSSGIFPDVDLTPYGGEEGGVSRRHARLLHIGDDYFVEDLQATNFTKLDGQRLPAHAREKIEDGARLDFGRVAVIFRRS